MSLKNYDNEQLTKMSMIELANLILTDEKKSLEFKDIFQQVADIKGLTESQRADIIAQFYTDLNMDGRFITTGSNLWGLKRWYPVDQQEEEITHTPKKKKAKKKKVKEDPLGLESGFDSPEDDLEDDDFDDVLDDEDDEIDVDFDDADDEEDYDDFDDDEDDEDFDDEIDELEEDEDLDDEDDEEDR